MAISVADNFSYQGTKPLDARVKFDTVANMKAFAEAKLYDGCLAYVTGTKKYYSFDSTNTVDPDTGKWREYSTGGSYALPIASDKVLGGIKVGDNLEIGDDGTLNAILPNVDLSNEISGHNVYSATEKLIGQWTDGKPLYQKVVQSVSGGIDANAWTSIGSLGVGNNVVDKIIVLKGMITNSSGTDFYTVPQKSIGLNYIKSTDVIKIYCDSDWIHKPFYIVAQYTKTADSAKSIGSLNDYSTTEKIIGTWIDGKPLYQKTYYVGTLGQGTIENPYVASIDISSDSSKWGTVVELSGIAYNSTTKNVRPLPFCDPVSNNNAIRFDVTGNPSLLRAVCVGNWDNGYSVYATIKYTKSTD